jgi:hypothetical protein
VISVVDRSHTRRTLVDLSRETVQQLVDLLMLEGRRWHEANPEASAYEIEIGVREAMQQVGRAFLGKMYEAEEERYPPEEVTCDCGGNAKYHFRREGKTLSCLGRVSYRRAYYVCPSCHRGAYPLDRRLGLRAGQVSVALAELLALEGIEVSFEQAQRRVAKMLLIDVSENTIRKETQAFGELRAEEETEWIQESREGYDLLARRRMKEKPPNRLYGSLDGVIVPVDGEWRELKCLCWYTVEDRAGPSSVGESGSLRASQIEYYCDLGDTAHLHDLVWATGYKRGADRAREVVFVADGAAWIWKLVREEFPGAVQIVDWYHAVKYISDVATAAFGAEELKQEWRRHTQGLLWEGKIEEVIAACREKEQIPAAVVQAQKAITYFTNNKERMDYKRYRDEGYQIGSGTVESACKQIGTQRLKRAGARWGTVGAQYTSKARAAYLGGQMDSLVVRKIHAAQAA